MAWKKKDPRPYRDCVVCGEQFDRAERGWTAITCSDECGHVRQLRMNGAYRREHMEENRVAVANYKARRGESVRELEREGKRKRYAARKVERESCRA